MYWPAFALRGRPLSAALSSSASAARVRDGGDQMTAVVGARQRTHAPRRVSARGRGVWTLAEASVECRVMSGATATGADEAGRAEERKRAGGRDGTDRNHAVERERVGGVPVGVGTSGAGGGQSKA